MASRQVPQHIKLKEYNRIRALRRKYGRVPDGQGQFTYDGKVYKVKTNNADPTGFQIKQVAVDQAADSTRRGVRLKLDDYVNHPRYKGAPELAKQMYEYDKKMLKLQSRHASKFNQLDHISPVKGVEPGIEHYRNKILLGSRDNGVKSNRQPSKAALDYMQIGTSKADMIDKAASSPWPKQTPRDKRTILQGDLNIEMTKGMGRPAPNGDLHLPTLRNAAKGLAVGGVAALGPLGTAASASETAIRTKIANKTKNPLDQFQAMLSGFSLGADALSYAPPATIPATIASTAADVVNGGIDAGRDIYNSLLGK